MQAHSKGEGRLATAAPFEQGRSRPDHATTVEPLVKLNATDSVIAENRATELFHDQWQSISGDRHDQDEGWTDSQTQIHRQQQQFYHPTHVHGGPFTVVALDGQVLPTTARYDADTVNVGPGQRYDVIWKARLPGKWLVHCHIPHDTSNNNAETHGGGGLTMIIDVTS
jgi:multicopper oxidase